jgi:hypothetical protein
MSAGYGASGVFLACQQALVGPGIGDGQRHGLGQAAAEREMQTDALDQPLALDPQERHPR